MQEREKNEFVKKSLPLFLFLFLPTLTHAADPYDYLAERIVKEARVLKNKKIAVLPLVYLGGEPSSAPEIVAERLTTRIVQKGGVQVIERGLISKVLSEKHLALTGAIDNDGGWDLGKILSVDAIVTGTINDISKDHVEINIRLITANEGKVLVAAGKAVKRTWPKQSDTQLNKIDRTIGKEGGQKVIHHALQKGDSLRSLAQKYYGDSEKWPMIFNANQSKFKRVLKEGEEIIIP